MISTLKNHQEYVNKFDKRINCSTKKVWNTIIVNDSTSSKSTYENISEINKNNEGIKEKENHDAITWKHATCLVVGDTNYDI